MGLTRLGAILLAALLVSAACSRPIQPVLEPEQWDFGTVSAAAPLEWEITVGNPGSREMAVSFLSTCDCLAVAPQRLELPPGARQSTSMRYDPSEDEGEVRMQVIVRAEQASRVSRGILPVVGYVLPSEAGGTRSATEEPLAAAAAAGTRPPEPMDSQPPLSFEYFYDPGCKACETFVRGKTWLWQEELGVRLDVQRRDLSDPGTVALYERRLEELGAEEQAYPAVVFNGVVLQGYDEIERELKGLLQQSLARGRQGSNP